MQPTFLGKVTVASAGTPAPVTVDTAIRACKLLFVTIPGLIGNIYVGGANLNQNTLQGMMIKFNAPGSAGEPDYFEIESPDGSNSLHPSDYWLDASVDGEGLLVTYFQT
jgi:hypothetical protein